MSVHPVRAQTFFYILQAASLSIWNLRHMEKKPVLTQMAQTKVHYVVHLFPVWMCFIYYQERASGDTFDNINMSCADYATLVYYSQSNELHNT